MKIHMLEELYCSQKEIYSHDGKVSKKPNYTQKQVLLKKVFKIYSNQILEMAQFGQEKLYELFNQILNLLETEVFEQEVQRLALIAKGLFVLQKLLDLFPISLTNLNLEKILILALNEICCFEREPEAICQILKILSKIPFKKFPLEQTRKFVEETNFWKICFNFLFKKANEDFFMVGDFPVSQSQKLLSRILYPISEIFDTSFPQIWDFYIKGDFSLLSTPNDGDNSTFLNCFLPLHKLNKHSLNPVLREIEICSNISTIEPKAFVSVIFILKIRQ